MAGEGNRVRIRVTARDLTGNELRRVRRNFNSLGQDIDRAVGARTRQNFARLQQSVTQSRRDLMNLRGSIPDEEFFRLDQRMRQAQRSLQRGFGRTTDRSFARIVARLREVDEGFRRLDESGDIRVRVDDSAIRRADRRLASANRNARQARRGVNGLADSILSMGRRTRDPLTKLTKKVATLGLQLIRIPALLGVAAAAIVPAVAIAFTGLAALAFRADKEIRGAFTRTFAEVEEIVQSAAEPMRGPLLDAMGEIVNAARELEPALRRAFELTAPLVVPLVNTVGIFANRVMPGLIDALSGAMPVIAGVRDAFISVGEAISTAISLITSDKDALAGIWRTVGDGLGELITEVAELTKFLVESGTAARSLDVIFTTLILITNTLEGVFRVLNLGMEDATASSSDWQLALEKGRIAQQEFVRGNFSEWWKITRMSVDEFRESLNDGTSSTDLFVEAMGGAREEALSGAEAIKALDEQFNELNRTALAAIDSEIAFEQAIAKVVETTKNHTAHMKLQNGEIDLTDAKTQELIKPFLELARRTLDHRDAIVKQTGSWKEGREVMERGRKQLIAQLTPLIQNKRAAERLADAILDIPSDRHTQFTANADSAISEIQRLRNNMALIQGGPLGVPFRAMGGVIPAARNGGLRSNETMVGEAGPEIVRLPPGAHVRSNPDTRRDLAGRGGGGGGGTTLVLKSSGNRVDDLLVELLREAIHERGGDPVQVLGG